MGGEATEVRISWCGGLWLSEKAGLDYAGNDGWEGQTLPETSHPPYDVADTHFSSA